MGHGDDNGFTLLEVDVHRHEFHLTENGLESNEGFLTVASTLVEAEIHDSVAETKAVAIGHLEVTVSAVGGVGGYGDVEGGHTGDEHIFLKGSVSHGDGLGGRDHGSPGWIEVGG